MFIRLRIYNPQTKKARVIQSTNYRSFSARFTGGEIVGMHVSYKVRYSKHQVIDTWGDKFWIENESPVFKPKNLKEAKEFISDIYQTANSDDAKFHLEYWGLKD